MLSGLAFAANADKPEELMWDNMVPLKDNDSDSILSDVIADPGAWDQLDFQQPVAELNGKYVKIPGFVVPLESDEGGLLSEFLLVPYFGACIHSPPPPPNQIVYVTFKEPVMIESIYDPFWITGTLETKPFISDVADSVYSLSGKLVEEYEY